MQLCHKVHFFRTFQTFLYAQEFWKCSYQMTSIFYPIHPFFTNCLKYLCTWYVNMHRCVCLYASTPACTYADLAPPYSVLHYLLHCVRVLWLPKQMTTSQCLKAMKTDHLVARCQQGQAPSRATQGDYVPWLFQFRVASGLVFSPLLSLPFSSHTTSSVCL